MRHLRSLPVRMVLSHVLVATLTSLITALIVVAILMGKTAAMSAAFYDDLARLMVLHWQFNGADGQPNAPGLPPGFAVVAAPDGRVLLGYGDTRCRAGALLRDCAAELVGRPTGARFITRDGQRWGESVQLLATGQRVLVRYGPPSSAPSIILGDVVITGTLPFLLTTAGAMLLISIPLSLLLAWMWVRPMSRRVARLAHTSQRFAAGDFAGRVRDQHADEIGELAQQFDAMADTLALNIHALRDMAERNAQLAQQAAQSATLAERLRLSRDLHDEIAQQLFSLSVRAATLPQAIEHDAPQAAQQARAIAAGAEQTLLSLRALLIELRPARLLQRGLATAIQELGATWESTHRVAVQCSVVLTGRPIAPGVEDVLYHSAQEALHNVAKHAQARTVALALVEGQRQITLSVSDDGRGFACGERVEHGHFGLLSMRERAAAVGGAVEIESDAARGTTLRVTLPLARDAVVEADMQPLRLAVSGGTQRDEA